MISRCGIPPGLCALGLHLYEIPGSFILRHFFLEFPDMGIAGAEVPGFAAGEANVGTY